MEQVTQIDQRGTLYDMRHTQFKDGRSRGSCSLRPWPPSEEDPACCPACHPDPGSSPCIPESSSHLLEIQPGIFRCPPCSLWRDASPRHSVIGGRFNIGSVYFPLFPLLLVLLVKLVLFSSLKLSLPFPALPCAWRGARGLTERICHCRYCHRPPR